jgi:hypothetical protein
MIWWGYGCEKSLNYSVEAPVFERFDEIETRPRIPRLIDAPFL